MTNKLLATIKSTSATKDGTGSFESVLSMPTVDRDNEVIDARAFEPLPDHITIDIDHAMSVEKTVGSGQPYYDDNGILRFKGTYASTPLAQMVRTLVDEGHIRTMSVAFMPGGEWEVDERDGKSHLRKGELLNAGIVGIPSNREALITASKSLAHVATELADVATEPVTGKAFCADCQSRLSAPADVITDTDEKAAAADVKSAAAVDLSVDVSKAYVELALAAASLAL